MARLHEYEGKALLAKHGVAIPRGGVARSAEDAARIAASLGCPVVLKIQAWTTGRKAIGGVAFAKTAEEAAGHAARLLAMKVGNFPVEEVLIEEMIPIRDELFVSLTIDDRARAPVILLSLEGGSGIEERAHGSGGVHRLLCDVSAGPDEKELAALLAASPVDRSFHGAIAEAVRKVFDVAKQHEARSVEINPLVTTADGRVMAADCRIAIDDYAVFRHPELGIEIARELDHPPTRLERIAYAVEQADHRGTFFFAQMNTAAKEGSAGLVGFHGAGGGGSMMSMDAITSADAAGGAGFTVANFCDTSGNPSPAKVYRAARIILSQPGLVAYFGSGSGVANQEQFWSAYGLAKAFWEMELDIPAVIRLGGNTEDRAVEILQSGCKGLTATVEGYRKTDPPAKIASRVGELVRRAGASGGHREWKPRKPRRPEYVGAGASARFEVKGGRVWIDGAGWKSGTAAAIVARAGGLLKDEGGKPALAVTPAEFMGKDSEMIACEVECRRDGIEGVFVELDVPGLD